jgi:glycosyltransferase involved in cell wall biosynthesis
MASLFTNLETLLGAIQVKQTPVKTKFLLIGTHAHQTTGYSKVTYHLIQELAKYDFIDLYHFGFQKFVDPPPNYRAYPQNVQVYDPVVAEREKRAPAENGFGYSQVADYVQTIQPDIVMLYNDAGVICQFLNKLTERFLKPTYKVFIYLDQVYPIQRLDHLERMNKDVTRYFVFTKYWEEVLRKQGITKPISVLRHGFDKKQFIPLNREAMRRKHGIPENLFMILNMNRNTPRKRHDIVVQAFAELVARHPAKPLALLAVCDTGEHGGFPIHEIYVRELERLGISAQFHIHKLMISKSSMSFTDEMVNELYAISDIGITGADGEGFGLCQFEAMGVGIPQVVPYIGGFRDFCRNQENSLTVVPKWRSYLPLAHSSVGGYVEIMEPHDLMLAAEEYLMDSELRERHGKAARDTVLEYDWAKEVQSLAEAVRTS